MGQGDSGHFADGGEVIFQPGVRPDADTGHFSDGGELVTVQVTSSDAGAWAESQSVSIPGPVTQGRGDGTRAPVAVADVAGSPPWNHGETGRFTDGGEAVVIVGGAKGDSGHFADGGESILVVTVKTDSDTGSWRDGK